MRELAPGIVVFDNIFPESMDYIKKISDQDIKWRPAEVGLEDNRSGVIFIFLYSKITIRLINRRRYNFNIKYFCFLQENIYLIAIINIQIHCRY
jgi:hypothetical protein